MNKTVMEMEEKVKYIIELSKLVCVMQERGATTIELLNVGEFFKAVMTTKMECDDIYEFDILTEYHKKYLIKD